ncbi:hypothetical protein [Flavisolibacter tropicus]|uniref:ABC transporter ATPase n=1 Tax=Flavisolibacter tropicus TaxID=1492898 RepID=A0A172TQW9_9BACT|nr:hypothetical protein [Flavisolibacter tropicus]ANE49386.1 hypothetical protein SY85_01575 [Flavisolibacter tropicus]
MNLEYKHLLPEDFSPSSRVWIYQSSRLFSLSEAFDIEDAINKFCEEWRSHGADVKAYGNLFFGQFVVLIADESQAAVSGCSTDSSVRFIKQLGEQFHVDFFDRTTLAFIIKDKVQLLPLAQFGYAADNGFINGDTLYFNNLAATKEQLENNWLIPVKDSWLARKLKTTI